MNKNNRVFKMIAATLLAISLTACSAGSGKLDWNEARKVKPGMTQEQVTGIMGRPYAVASKGGGTTKYVWIHVMPFSGSQTMSVGFKDGIAVDVPEIPTSF